VKKKSAKALQAEVKRLEKQIAQMSVLIGRSMYRGYIVSDIYDSYFMGETEREVKAREIAELKQRIADLSQVIYEFETDSNRVISSE
jgi:uncharacterized small protein (DUF1192 family)